MALGDRIVESLRRDLKADGYTHLCAVCFIPSRTPYCDDCAGLGEEPAERREKMPPELPEPIGREHRSYHPCERMLREPDEVEIVSPLLT